MPERTLVVGTSGFLGSEVTRQLRDADTDVVGTVHEGKVPISGVETVGYDFWNDDLGTILDTEGIERVIFVATVERGDGRNRGLFDRSLDRFVDACRDRRVVYVSTDAVFDGADGPYDEGSDPSPASEYGRRVRAFERVLEDHCPDHCIVRPSYLYGFSGGTLDPRLAATRERIRDGETVAYFEDAYKSPISIGDAAEIVTDLTRHEVTGVVHAAAPRTSIHEFHRAAMDALDEPAGRVVPESVPPESDYPRDTSLVSGRLESVLGADPGPVSEALERSRP
ncbi:sugar nucleotide-binding protein [Saliphagus infecundisoli]|uniref:Sugar nucleotide-binding protein n=1 Tax=Saliphagus infecundisoli TaxID=1849069 RepID=A0ABD5QHC2_9EURY|nr:sugar nucleotide-binding protein [Saliphagus infecundisoli]